MARSAAPANRFPGESGSRARRRALSPRVCGFVSKPWASPVDEGANLRELFSSNPHDSRGLQASHSRTIVSRRHAGYRSAVPAPGADIASGVESACAGAMSIRPGAIPPGQERARRNGAPASQFFGSAIAGIIGAWKIARLGLSNHNATKVAQGKPARASNVARRGGGIQTSGPEGREVGGKRPVQPNADGILEVVTEAPR